MNVPASNQPPNDEPAFGDEQSLLEEPGGIADVGIVAITDRSVTNRSSAIASRDAMRVADRDPRISESRSAMSREPIRLVRAHDRAAAAVAVDDVLAEPLAEEHLRLARVVRVLHEADDVEVQLRERAAHLVEPVLGLDDDLVEAVGERPDFLLFGERAEVPLAAPVAAGAANPLIEDAAAVELHHVLERGDEIGQLRIALLSPAARAPP